MADGNGGATLDTISIRISASSKSAANSIDRLKTSLDNLRRATASSFRNLSDVRRELSVLSSATNSLRNIASPVNSLSRSLERLNGVNIRQATDSLRSLANLSNSLTGMGDSVDSIRAFRSGVNSLLGSIDRLQQADLTGVSDRVTQIVNAIRPLTNEMIRAGSGMSNFGQNLRDMVAAARGARGFQSLNAEVAQYNERVTRANRSSRGLRDVLRRFASLVSVSYVFREIGQAISKAVSSSIEYIEAMNLASVSLGELAGEAREYTAAISSALGVDQGEMLKNMGLFQNLATSFGMANDQAYILSKGMTQLAYDFASFHNLDIEESFLKFQSALAGELEPIRRVGVDISNARLQQELYDLGLRQNISTLGRADKAMLTYIAIMKQSNNEMGDMARTVTSPANMLRVLGNQATITARQIGNVFVPVLKSIIPWAIAVVRVIGQLVSMFASVAGIQMPEIDAGVDTQTFTDLSNGLDGVGESADDAAKKVNNLIGGFDELNILQKDSGTAGSDVNLGNVLSGIDLSQFQYNMLEGLIDPKIDSYIRKITDFLNAFKNSAGVKLLTSVLKSLWGILKPFGEWILAHPDTVANWLVGIGVAILTYKLITGIANLATAFKNLGKAASASGLLGGLKALGGIFTNPWALVIAGVAAAVTLVGLAIWQASEDAKKARLDSIFGDIVLTFEEVQKAAEALATTDLSIELDYYVKESDSLAEMYNTIENTLTELKTQQWLASIGVEIDLDAYSVQIDDLIKQTQEALDQQEHVYTMGIEIGVNNEGVAAEMTEFVKEYMNSSRTQLENLGHQLRKTVDDALADGVLSGAELETIANLQKEMQEVMDRVTQANVKAEWTAFTMDWSGVDLQFESWNQVMDAANKMVQDQMQELEGIRLQNLQIAELALAEGSISAEKYQTWVDEIERSFMENKLALTANVDQFAINTMGDSYQNAIGSFGTDTAASIAEALTGAFDGMFGEDQNGEVRKLNVNKFLSAIEQEIHNGIPSLKGAVSSIVENIKPQEDEWLAQKAYYEQMGMEVPQSVANGLANIEALRGLTTNTELLYAEIANVLKDSPEVKNALEAAGLTGEDLIGSLLDGIVATSNADMPIITQESEEMYNAAISKLDKEGAKAAGVGVVSSTTAGITEQMAADMGLVQSEFEKMPEAARNAMGLNTQNYSSKFNDMGEGVGNSFWDGLERIWDRMTSWLSKQKLTVAAGEVISTNTYTSTRNASRSVATNPDGSYLEFANGNVATDPTLAIFGEYPGAKSNPEITAPQSTIYETVVAANSEMVGAVYQMANMIVEAIENNSTEISADSRGIFKAVKKEASNYQKAHGVPAF